jgi:hypothetical protein
MLKKGERMKASKLFVISNEIITLCLVLAVSLTSCLKPPPTAEELKLQEETELALRINEQYPFSFEAPAVKTYRYEDNHRLFSLDDGWVYYSSIKSDDNRNWICLSRLDGSDKTWIASLEYPRDAQWFVAYGKWIFFLEYSAPKSKRGRIYRINKDGTQKTPMEEIYANNLYLQDDWLYYTRYGAVGRMRPDGSAHEIILEMDGIYQSFLAEDWLYVSVTRGGDGYVNVPPLELYRVHISGSPVIRLDNEELNPANIQVAGDWVYFQNWLKDQNLYRVHIEGGTAENLFEGKEFTLRDYDSYYVAGDWIVFTQREMIHLAPVVNRMLTDGSYVEMITDSLPISLDANTMMFSRGYLSSSERIGDSKESIGEEHLTLYKLDNDGQLHIITSLKADYYINLLSFHGNGLIYELATKGDHKVRWLSLDQD